MDKKTLTLLVIDDNPDNLISLKALIKEAFPEANTLLALTGKQGLELAVAENPDVILLDILMPEMDGFEVCRRIKGNPLSSDIPVVFVTALKGDRESRIHALEAGAEAFLSKPVDNTELTAQIRAMAKIKSANSQKRNETERLEALVKMRTAELEKELQGRRDTEAALRESEEKFRHVFESANVGKSITHFSGEIKVNQSFCDLLGYAPEELQKKKWQDLTPPEEIEPVQQKLNLLLSGNKAAVRFEKRYIHKNGSPIWTDVNVTIRRDKAGAPLYFIVTIIDISERKLAEVSLRESERKLNEAQEIAKLGNWEFDLVNDKLFWSDEVYRIFEIDPTESVDINKTFFETIHPEDRDKVSMAYETSLQSKIPYNIQHRLLTKSGLIKYVFENCITYYDASGKPLRSVGTVQDITDQKLAGEQMNELRNRYQSLFENSLVGTGLATLDGKIIECNEAFASMLGYEINEIKSQIAASFYLNPDERITVRDRLIQEEVLKDYETKLRHKNGTFITVLMNISVIKLQGDIFLQTTCLDITKRKMAEESLRDEQQRLDGILKGTNVGTWEWNVQTGKTIFNERWAEIIGYTLDELAPVSIETWMKYTHPDDLQSSGELLEKHFRGELDYYECEARMKHKNGHWIWVLDRGRLVSRTNAGLPQMMMGTHQDITDRKRSEAIQEVQYSIARSIIKTEQIEDLLEMIRHDLSKVIDVSNFIVALYNSEKDTLRKIIFKDENDSFSEWPVATSFSGYVVKLGKTLFMNRHEIEEFMLANHLETIGTPAACWIGVPITIQNRVMGVIVTQSYTKMDAFSISDVALLEMVAHEISIYLDRKQMLDALITAKEKAEESDKLKTAFINNISHEIRTPLNGILGFGQLLAEPDLAHDERENYFRKVQRSSERLMDTINDYMDIARIVSGSLSVHKKSFLLKASLEDVFDEFRMLSNEKYLDFELSIPDDHNDLILFSDKELVVKILRELLDNAVKFTQKGKISVGYHTEGNSVVFFVKDTGKGISNEKLAMIFDLFTQEDTSITRGHEGSGLGLSIAKGMVELLGGRIWAISEKGTGSTFYFSVLQSENVSNQKSLQPFPENVSEISKPLILVAEDDESNYLYLEVVIKKTCLDFIIVQNGAEAVEKVRQYPHIILVLMDIKMPVMNGLEATKIIKGLRPGLPVIALTAYAQTGDGHRMIQAGCDDYYPKPIKPEILNKIIHKYIKQ